MSIRGAIDELNAEIQRVTELRDALLHFEATRVAEPKIPSSQSSRRDKAASNKTAPAKKAPSRKGAAPAKQKSASRRVVSAETRKKMSDAAKARSAAKKTSPTK